ncbi:DUF4153 domain-containing protein [Hymenobacter metallilatus]|uniref:DUF4153 domain-containing protein n=1 Tax=Hymenobacter metallilatus TaxID=2493666 RepID=A0A3R9N451_9BACT|nr:DUF4153 domain-containing protein [Hymenobacter metallilatus]RSK24772.1 DUF4153 domain-containing protein [Hymenobacter metallilatus]
MKLPSLQHLAAEAARVVRRFPLTLLCAFVLCGVGMNLVQLSYQEQKQLTWLFPVLSAAMLGLSSTLAVALTAERYRWPLPARWGALALLAGLLAGWYAVAPPEPTPVWGSRLALLLLGAHLAVAAGPYLSELRRSADTPGFWRYNETLFLRILTAGLYSGVLFVGCALALTAVKQLFDADINERWFGYLFVGLSTVFNTWFFLAGVPYNFEALEEEAPYPKPLKLFTQFVLLPLVVLYLGILYAYLGRIILLWTLPKGWVSLLVLALAVAGIFALLLIHPIRQAAENTWIRTFGRWFYLALFPLLGLLAVAIGTRIRAYGITEERYFVLVLAAWLLGMAVYFLVRRGQGIIWIPASLAVVAFLAAGGPWGAYAVAERSQLNQLREISARYGLLQAGKLDGAGERMPNLPDSVRKRISSVFEFFADREALERLQPLFAASLTLPDSLLHEHSWSREMWLRNRLTDASGIVPTGRYEKFNVIEDQARFTNGDDMYELGSGRYWLRDIDLSEFRDTAADSVLQQLTTPTGVFRLRAQGRGRQLVLERQQATGNWQQQLMLTPGTLADSLARVYGRHPERNINMTRGLGLRAESKRIKLRLFLQDLARQETHDTVLYYYSGHALLEVTN